MLTSYLQTMSQDQQFIIFLDSSFLAPTSPVTIPAGLYPMPGRVVLQPLSTLTSDFQNLHCEDGCVFTGVNELTLKYTNLSSNMSTPTPLITINGSFFNLLMDDAAIFAQNTNGNTIQVDNSGVVVITMQGDSTLYNAGHAGTYVVGFDSSGVEMSTLAIDAFCFIGPDVFGPAPGNIFFSIESTNEASIDPSYASITIYASIQYTPADPTNWTTYYGSVPASVNTALDLLAGQPLLGARNHHRHPLTAQSTAGRPTGPPQHPVTIQQGAEIQPGAGTGLASQAAIHLQPSMSSRQGSLVGGLFPAVAATERLESARPRAGPIRTRRFANAVAKQERRAKS